MGTQLVLTVGTNALPVWVAWHWLKDKLEQPAVTLVHTEETKSEMKQLKDSCGEAGKSFSNLKTSSGNIATVTVHDKSH